MAEFPELGSHCAKESCQQLDFLPFLCDTCQKYYCKDHKSHLNHECVKETKEPKEVMSLTTPISYVCSFSECNVKELTPIVCEGCQKHFCLRYSGPRLILQYNLLYNFIYGITASASARNIVKALWKESTAQKWHRHQEEHNCEVLASKQPTASKTEEHVKAILASRQNEVPVAKKTYRSEAAKKTANQVMVMKLKMKAIGSDDIPLEDRLYFNVVFPVDENKYNKKPLYFSKNWTVGRAIDFSATANGLINQNNVSLAKKLRIFSSKNGSILPPDETLAKLVAAGDLENGDTLLLEYVEDSCSILENLLKYQNV